MKSWAVRGETGRLSTLKETMPEKLLRIEGLTVTYGAYEHAHRALDEVSLDLTVGERVAIVGESGSGKSTLVRAILGMLPQAVVSGSIRYGSTELVGADDETWSRIRGAGIALVPQDPLSSLDPLMRVGEQVAEGPVEHRLVTRHRRRAFAETLLERARMPHPAQAARRYPHELSGGLRQRVLIANGIASSPRLLLADEPTSALDVTVQRRILDSLDELVRDTGVSLLLVTHDLGVARERADRIIVMRGGRVIEEGPAARVSSAPRTAYARQLIDAVPSVSGSSLVGAAPGGAATPVLVADGLTKSFVSRSATGRTATLVALAGLNFELHRGETLALVGESGSGKTTAANLVLGLERPDSGRVLIDGVDVTGFRDRTAKSMRRRIQPVFQDPGSSLDSRYTVERAIVEPLVVNRLGNPAQRSRRAAELADRVALPAALLSRRVTELSGGQKQRVALARALALEPDILVCDEPVSSLDVIVQEQILQLIVDLQSDLGLSCLFITHDLGVVRRIAHRVIVLRGGKVQEEGEVDAVLRAPSSAYGQELLAAVPTLA